MKKSFALFGSVIALSVFALVACDDNGAEPNEKPTSSSTSGSTSGKYDCSVSKGVKVVYPAGGETFKLGNKIKVVFGSDVDDGSYRFMFTGKREDGTSVKKELIDPSLDSEKLTLDGKTCNEVEVSLSEDKGVIVSDEATIRVIPYENTNKMSESKSFKVEE